MKQLAATFRLETEVPDLPGESASSQELVFVAVDENQLWSIYTGLEQLKLIPVLKTATDKLAKAVLTRGKGQYKWS